MFRPTYNCPNIEMIGGRAAGEWDIEGKRRSKILDDLPDFEAMIVHVEGIDKRILKRISSGRESLWKDYFGNLNRIYTGKEDRIWFNR